MDGHIPFNKPFVAGKEMYYIAKAILGGHSAGDGPFTSKCQKFIEQKLKAPKALLTQSYASALDMAAMLCQIESEDEVIMPSFAFVSVANAFYMRGAIPVFVDIRPDTLNLDESKIESAITKQTKAIVTPHYAGVGCEMKIIQEIASRHNLFVIEDAANGFGAKYGEKNLGTIGDLGVLSFHETNAIICGEGGAILINNDRFIEKAEIIREKGTNRSKFFRGEVDKYTWVEIGSSFLPSDLVAAFLYGQLEQITKISASRRNLFDLYFQGLKDLEDKGLIRLPVTGRKGTCKGHIMYIITRSLNERTMLIKHLERCGIKAIFHYTPLHTSPMGKKHGRTHGSFSKTLETSERLLRLPMYYEMRVDEVERVVQEVHSFYRA
jgi:dTDP-4-amino-4,6-dideoxygalactose transaminase